MFNVEKKKNNTFVDCSNGLPSAVSNAAEDGTFECL